MKIFKLDKEPLVYSWKTNQDVCADIDFKDFLNYIPTKTLPDAVFYWYVEGDYEGSGDLIAVMNGKWYYKSLNHCSCYGPLEDYAESVDYYSYDSLNAMLESCSGDLLKEVSPLIEFAKKNGYS